MIKFESWNGSRKGMQVMWGMLNSVTFAGLSAFSSPLPSHCRLLSQVSCELVSTLKERKKHLTNPTDLPPNVDPFISFHSLLIPLQGHEAVTVHHSKDTLSLTHSHPEAVLNQWWCRTLLENPQTDPKGRFKRGTERWSWKTNKAKVNVFNMAVARCLKCHQINN